MKRVTIADVAERAGVSKSTVSAVLNDKAIVQDRTRRLVLRAMEDLRYRPRASARRGFTPPSSRTLALVVKEARNPFYGQVLAGVQEVADREGYLVSIGSTEGRYELEQQLVRQYVEQEVGGLLVAPILESTTDLSHLFELKRHNVPFVLVEGVRGLGANLIEVDNVLVSCKVIQHLIREGHTRILHLSGPSYSQHTQERIEGVRRAFSESHLIFDESMIVPAGSSLEDGYRAGLCVFRDLPAAMRPTAVFCYNDLVAIGLLRGLRELGIGVPEEVSVFGFDDLQILDYLPLPLSTVRVPCREIGRRAAELLIRQIESEGELPPERVCLDAELVVRQSTRPPLAAVS